MSVSIVKRAQRHRRAVRWYARIGFTALMIAGVQAQQRGGTAQTDKVQPVNSGANPYRVIRDWAQLALEGQAMGRLQRRGHRPGRQVRVGDGPVLARDNARAASAPRRTRSTISMIQGRRSGALAAGCSCGRMASMSIARATCG